LRKPRHYFSQALALRRFVVCIAHSSDLNWTDHALSTQTLKGRRVVIGYPDIASLATLLDSATQNHVIDMRNLHKIRICP
jgi:hypothetical protein